MTGIVVVSHSRALAEAALGLAAQMAPSAPQFVHLAAGLDDGSLGTDATAVMDAIEAAAAQGDVVVLMDLGSAVLSTSMALDLLDDELRARVIVSPAPFVEGLVAAVVTAAGGGAGAEVAREAAAALAMKSSQLADDASVPDAEPRPALAPTATAEAGGGDRDSTEIAGPDGDAGLRQVSFDLINPQGLHARPAAVLVSEMKKFDAAVEIRDVTRDSDWMSAASIVAIMGLGAESGHHIDARATGPEASAALHALTELAQARFGEV